MGELKQSKSLDSKVYSELVKLLYSGSKYRPCLHLASATIMTLIIVDQVPLLFTITWLIILAAINIYRFIDISKTQKMLDEITDFKILQRRFAISACLLGLVYGLGIISIFNRLDLISQMYLLCMISALTPAGLVSFASDKLSFYSYLFSLTVPVILHMFLIGELPYIAIAIFSVVFILIGVQLFIWNHTVLRNSIKLSFDNEKLLKSLGEANERLTLQNTIDELTHIANRRYLDEMLEKEWLRAKRTKSPLSILMIDIDYFKQYNDTYGHLKGDECLTLIAATLNSNLSRSGDFVARYGGEEFCILMPNTNLDGAINTAEKIHSAVIKLKIKNPKSEVNQYLTISVGVATAIPRDNDSYMDLIYTSDKALYKAKKEGRNKIKVLDDLQKNPKPRLVI